MRIPLGGRQRNEGLYGGVGSKPAQKPWTPKVHEAEAPTERVPRRFRGLRLRRRRRSRMEPTPDYVLIPILVAASAFVFLIIRIFFA